MEKIILLYLILLLLIFISITILTLIYLVKNYSWLCYNYAISCLNIKHDMKQYEKNIHEIFPEFHKFTENNTVTKKQLNLCNKKCINKNLDSSAINISYNNWNKDVKDKYVFLRGPRLIYQYIRACIDHRYALPTCTGGSSGNTFNYWYNYTEGIKFIGSTMRCWIPFGWNPDKNIGVYYGHPSSGLTVLDNVHYIIPHINILIPTFTQSGDIANIDRFIKFLNIQKPYVIETMPNLIFRVCQYIYLSNLEIKYHPKLLSLSGDFLFTCQYKFIKSIFPKSVVRMVYGTVEFGQIAQQDDDNDLYTYKVFNEYAYVENMPDGRLIVTRFDYTNMPMYRYVTDDYGDVINKNNQQYITNLVGKKKYDYLSLDKKINQFSDKYKIINVRFNKSNKLELVSLLDDIDSVLNYSQKIFPEYEITVIKCVKHNCINRDRFDTKVLPILH